MIKYICAALTITFLTNNIAFASAEQSAEDAPPQVAPVKGPREQLAELEIELGLERVNHRALSKQYSDTLRIGGYEIERFPRLPKNHPYSVCGNKIHNLIKQIGQLTVQIAKEKR